MSTSSGMKSRMPLYLGLAAAGAGGYYLYRAGGDPKKVKNEANSDVDKAKSHFPRAKDAEKLGEEIDEVVQVARERAKTNDGSLGQHAKEGIDKIDQIRHDAARSMGTSVDKLDRKIEEKASEAKNSLNSISSWFSRGGK